MAKSLLEQLTETAELVDRMVSARVASTVRPDAIDAELGRPPRQTTVVSIRNSPEMAAFEQAFIDGEIKQDAVLALLNLINTGLQLLATPIAL